MFRKIGFILMIALTMVGSANLFAQRTFTVEPPPGRQDRNFTLTIRPSVNNATIMINNEVVRNNRLNLRAGIYQITVRAPGYNDFNASINLQSNQVIEAHLIPGAPQPIDNANIFVNCNVKGAQVYINDTLVGTIGARFTIPPGNYQIRVSAPGYQDFVSSMQVIGNQTINAILNPMSFMLTVTANVKDAQVFINNNAVGTAGSVFSMPPGNYQVKVSAPGFSDFIGTVNLTSNQTLNANLVSANYTLTVNANIKGAQVFINNNVVGTVGQVYSLQPGSYQVQISAAGFQDFNQTIQLNGNQVINAVLQGMSGTLNIEIPRNAALLVFVDGNVIKHQNSLSLPSGQHRVRFEMGFLVAETIVTINQGQTVTVAPSFSILVK